ncbi:FOLATE-BIOPTERIN TRANSPORTER 6-RELATED [Salix viminalis]|uniref:FOLATE-BIOPTERIN TRANSPORTER 6-RELATED n=1 Tax=Salix viminalis TaxID=40686 RepID=A0A9Q0NQ53_SALVM|nr:FOLATE-BIOPTERIN TRANSPORTER 6-RELATED [Salix viminalis]
MFLQAVEDLQVALRGMSKTIKLPQVWKPSLYMYLSLALSISTHEGQFYWYTDPESWPCILTGVRRDNLCNWCIGFYCGGSDISEESEGLSIQKPTTLCTTPIWLVRNA